MRRWNIAPFASLSASKIYAVWKIYSLSLSLRRTRRAGWEGARAGAKNAKEFQCPSLAVSNIFQHLSSHSTPPEAFYISKRETPRRLTLFYHVVLAKVDLVCYGESQISVIFRTGSTFASALLCKSERHRPNDTRRQNNMMMLSRKSPYVCIYGVIGSTCINNTFPNGMSYLGGGGGQRFVSANLWMW